MAKKRSIFRKEALDRLSSPDQVDALIRVLSPRDWLPLTCAAVLVAVLVGWAIFGRVRVTAAGNGVLPR